MPYDYETLKKQGEDALAEGRNEEALRHFEEALEEGPQIPEAYHNLGKASTALGLLDKAQEYYHKAIEVEDSYWKSYSNLSNIFLDEKNYTSALEYAQKALELNPQNEILYSNLGNCYKAMGQIKKAEECYKRALMLDEKCLKAKYNYAILLKEEKKWKEAISLFEEVAISPPEGAVIGVVKHLAETYFHIKLEKNSKEIEESLVHYFTKLLTLYEEIPTEKVSTEYFYWVNYQLAHSYIGISEYEKAIQKFNDCFKLDPSKYLEELLYAVAYSYKHIHNLDTALGICEKITRLENFNKKNTYILMSNIYQEKSDHDLSNSYYEKSNQ